MLDAFFQGVNPADIASKMMSLISATGMTGRKTRAL